MLILDANLLIYAYHAQQPQHPLARAWLEQTFAAAQPIGLPWQTLLACRRITTPARIFERPLGMARAQQIVGSWLEHPRVHVVEPGAGYFAVLSNLLAAGQVRGPLVTDAALAALAINSGATLCTTDHDFARFPKLKRVNPLMPQD